MAQPVFPAQRNYRFSSGLMNLKFMQRASGDGEEKNAGTARDAGRAKQAPALTKLEANRREMELRMQSQNCVTVHEERSFTKLYDLVVGRFNFRTEVESEPTVKSQEGIEDMEDGEYVEDDEDTTRKNQLKRKSDGLEEGDSRNQRTEGDDDTSKKQNGRYFTSYKKTRTGNPRTGGPKFHQRKARSKNGPGPGNKFRR